MTNSLYFLYHILLDVKYDLKGHLSSHKATNLKNSVKYLPTVFIYKTKINQYIFSFSDLIHAYYWYDGCWSCYVG